MSQPVDIDLNLSGDYTQGVSQATQATEGLASALNAIQAPARSVQGALSAATPSKVHLAAWGGFTAAAAYWQEQTSGIRATASAAGQSMRGLEGDVRRLASTFPIGTAGAVQLVQAVQGLGASQQRIRPLASEFERLAAATNSFGPEMAQGFGQLNRSMASLDPARVARFGDVLTTVSAKTGASAMGMISFAQSIAPVAQQAGIGESAVLGISAAFVKLGDDGGAAATAVNKILSDLNRSVREGSNDMAAYAQITGMTVDQFRKLYQANPAQALTAVTSSIGRAPSGQGQMMLESLGLEGVRTQRALLQLSQSGGLQSTINQAVGAYGNGSTQTASQAALGGLNSSLTELRSTAGQTADALGGPFLHVLTKITDIAKIGLGPLNSLLGSGVGQAGIAGFGALALTGMAARRVVRPLGSLALGAQIATSGPLRSAAGGYALGRAENDASRLFDVEGNPIGAMARFGAQPIANQAIGAPYGRGFMQPINRGFMRAGATLGGLRADMTEPSIGPTIGGPGLGGAIRRGARVGVGVSSMAYEGWLRAFADPFHQAVTPAGDRQSLLQTSQGGLFNRANQARQQAGIRAALGLLEREGTTGAAALGRFASATIGATKAVGTFAGRTMEAGLSAAAPVGRGLFNLAGGVPGLALMAGTGLYSLYQAEQSGTKSSNAMMRNTDIYSVENSWLDAVGAASKGATTMADAMASATSTINASVTNFTAARKVSTSDVVAAGKYDAGDQRANAPLNYALGSTGQVQALVQANALGGMTPQDMQGLKESMIKQGLPADRINQILAGVSTGGTGGQLTSGTIAGVAGAYGSARRSFDRHGHGMLATDTSEGRDATKIVQTFASAIGQQQTGLTEQFGPQYATQQSVRSIDQMMRALPRAQRYAFSNHLAAAFGYRGSGGAYNTADLLGMKGVSIGGMSGADLTRLLGGPALPAHLQPSIMDAPLRSVGANALLPFFASGQAPARFRAGQQATEYVAAGHEADVSAQTKAVDTMVASASKAGTSLADLALEATKATDVTAGWQQTMMQGIAAEAQFRQQISLQGAGRGAQLGAAVRSDLGYIGAGPGTDPNGFQAKQYGQAKQDLASQRQAIVEFYQQRAMAQYQYQIEIGRSQEDFQRQSSRSEYDYLLGRQRAWREYNINITRQAQDAATQMYNPYQRIQAKPVWDVANLTMNRGEQIQAMRQQLENIKTLRRYGITQATIDQLQLYDPNNAQQTSELVMELQNDRSGVGTLNRQAGQAQGLAGQLLAQSPEFRRQREDFLRSLSQQQRDFNTQQSRTRQDFNLAMTRMAQDIHTQDLEITNNLTTLAGDMNKILHGQTLDLSHQVHSTLEGVLAQANHYGPLIKAGLAGQGDGSSGGSGPTTAGGSVNVAGGRTGGGVGNSPTHAMGPAGPNTKQFYTAPGTGSTVGTGHVAGMTSTDPNAADADMRPSEDFMNAHPASPNYNKSIAKSMKPQWARGQLWNDWEWLWDAESGWNQYDDNPYSSAYGIAQLLGGNIKKYYWPFKDWRTNPASQIKGGIGYIDDRYHGSPSKAAAHERQYGWYAHGSIFTGPQIAGLGERGPEAAIPLNAQGLEFMVAALRQYGGGARGIDAPGMAYATHVDNSQHYYDNRNDFGGANITVKADDPRKMAREIDEERRRANLTATRGVARRNG